MLASRRMGWLNRNALRVAIRFYFSSDDETEPTAQTRTDTAKQADDGGSREGVLFFFEGGSGYGTGRRRVAKVDPLNVSDVDVPWVDDWYRTRQGFARIQLLSQKTNLSVDQVQSRDLMEEWGLAEWLDRIAKLLSMAPGLQKFMPLLHPALFSTILSNLSHSFEIMTMLKSELPAVELGIVISGFPRVLTWDKKLLRDCLCFLVVQFKGRMGAAEALNAYPMRFKYTRQLVSALFAEKGAETGVQKRVMGRLYQFNRHRKRIDPPKNTLVYFETQPPLRE